MYVYTVDHRKLTWNHTVTVVLKMSFLFEEVIFRFHDVSFRESCFPLNPIDLGIEKPQRPRLGSEGSSSKVWATTPGVL